MKCNSLSFLSHDTTKVAATMKHMKWIVVAIFPVTDTTFKGGSPGIGFFLQNASGLDANYGFSSLFSIVAR